MSERQLEDILAEYPDDFFPHRDFKLIGRQTSLKDVGRFDVLFQDGQQRKWLIELKAVALKITDTDQVMRYYEELCTIDPAGAYIPCFVAPVIPHHVRRYLDGKGIDYREITVAEFLRVARAHGVPLDLTTDDERTFGTEDAVPNSPSREIPKPPAREWKTTLRERLMEGWMNRPKDTGDADS